MARRHRQVKRRVGDGKAYREYTYRGGNPAYHSSWEKGMTYPRDMRQRKTVKSAERSLMRGDISLNTFNRLWSDIMKRLR